MKTENLFGATGSNTGEKSVEGVRGFANELNVGCCITKKDKIDSKVLGLSNRKDELP